MCDLNKFWTWKKKPVKISVTETRITSTKLHMKISAVNIIKVVKYVNKIDKIIRHKKNLS